MTSSHVQIQQWISFDNELKILNEKIKEIRNKKHNLLNDIFKQHPINSTINLGKDTLKIINTRITPPLTFKYLEKSLGEIIKNDTQVNQIIEHIKSHRVIHIIPEIKRIPRLL